MSQRDPTRTVGSAALVNSLVVSTAPVKLQSFLVFNNGGACWAHVHELATAAAAEGQIPRLPPFPIPSGVAAPGQVAMFALPAGIDLDKCVIVVSTAQNTTTAAVDNPAVRSIAAVVAG